MRKKLVSGLLVFILIISSGLTVYGEDTEEVKEPVIKVKADQFVEGIFVNDIDLTGLTDNQARSEIQKIINKMKKKTVTVKTDDHKNKIRLSGLGLKWNNEEILDEAMLYGKTGNYIARFKELKNLQKSSKRYELTYNFNRKKVKRFVKKKLKVYDQDPVEPTIKREDDEFKITPSENGIEVNVDKTAESIMKLTDSDWSNDNISIETVCKIKPSKHKTADLKKIRKVLGSKTTTYDGGNVGRTQSLALSTKRVNGTLLWPGETVSVSVLMGERSKAGGYGSAQGYIGTNVEDTVGAGICQTASTLYCAALYAELEIVERHHHTLIVHYVPYAMDSTIYAGSDYKNPQKDLKLKNPYDYPVYLEGYSGGGYCTFKVWGKETRPKNREVKYVSTTVSEYYPPEQVTKDPTQYESYYKVTQGAFPAVTAYLTKYVYVDGEEVEKTKLHTDSYTGSGRKVIRGTKKKETEQDKKNKNKKNKNKKNKNNNNKKKNN